MDGSGRGSRSDYCIICSGTEDLRIIHKVYADLGMSISYADLLVKCFYIQFLDKHCGKDNMLCVKCIKCIKFCINFRKKVEIAHKKLYAIKTTTVSSTSKQIQVDKTRIRIEPSIKTNEGSRDFINYSDNNDTFYDDDQESDSSVKTVEILRATGYKDLIKKSKEKASFAVPKLEPTQTQCPVCDKQLPDNYLLNKHHVEHFPAFICHVCGMSFTRESVYKKHLLSHNDPQFPCDLCDRKYNTRVAMHTHRKISHFNYHPFTCYRCKMRFKSGMSRKKHMLAAHGIKCTMIKCLKCDEEFFTSHLMEKHLKRKHLKLKDHRCCACSSTFFTATDLKRHYLVKHEGIKSYKCETCNKTFSYDRGLRTHRKIHLNQRDHVCQLCGAAFIQTTSLKYHIRTHHKEHTLN